MSADSPVDSESPTKRGRTPSTARCILFRQFHSTLLARGVSHGSLQISSNMDSPSSESLTRKANLFSLVDGVSWAFSENLLAQFILSITYTR